MSEPTEPAAASGKPPSAVGYVNLWAAGVQVRLPLPEQPVNYAGMLANLDAAIAAGFAVSLAGLEQGENKDVCAHVVRTMHSSRNGQPCSALDLYLPDDKFSKVRIYLNTAAEVAEFEAVSGLTVDRIPVYEGTNKIERFKAQDNKVIALPRPAAFVWKQNPAYNPDEKDASKKKPARLFVRWDGAAKPAANGQQPAANGKQYAEASQPDAEKDGFLLAKWKDFCMSDPPVEVFNQFCQREYPEVPKHMQQRVKQGIQAHANAAGWTWNDEHRCYVQPNDSTIPF